MVCPTDLLAGGTWLGVNDRGVFAAITNRFGIAKDAARRSRGELVLEALDEADATSAVRKIAAHDPLQENAFHLAIADRENAFLVFCDGRTLRSSELAPGLHTITERSFDAANTTRESFIRESLGALDAPPDDARLAALLSSHRDDSFEGLCVHVPQHGYGTRSSAIVRFGEAEEEASFRFANGAPHETAFESVELLRGSRSAPEK